MRALANINAAGIAEVKGPESEQTFEFDANQIFRKEEGSISLFGYFEPLSYNISSSAINQRGGVSASSFGLNFEANYWISRRFGIEVTSSGAGQLINNHSLWRSDFGLGFTYRLALGSSRQDFVLTPKLDLGMRQLSVDRPANSSGLTQSENLIGFGAYFGLLLRAIRN